MDQGTKAKKEKEAYVSSQPNEIDIELAKIASEIELLKGGQFPLNKDFEDLCLYLGGEVQWHRFPQHAPKNVLQCHVLVGTR